MDLKLITEKVVAIAQEVGEFIRHERINFNYNSVEIKGLNDLVSYVDKTSEKRIVEKLKELLSDVGFIVEENTISEKKEYNWIVDPLDGTTNFVHGIPCYAISIALEHRGEVVLGVVYEVSRNECFYAYKGGGSFLNGEQIQVSQQKNISESLIAAGFPIFNFEKIQPLLNCLEYLMRNTHGVRRMGAAAVDLCYVACGRVDAFFEYNLNAWDVAAGALIVKEAGGHVCDFSLSTNWLFGKEIIATNNYIKVEFQAIISKQFSKP